MNPSQTPDTLAAAPAPINNVAVANEHYVSNPIAAFMAGLGRLWATNFVALVITGIIGTVAFIVCLVLMFGATLLSIFGSVSSPTTEDTLFTSGAATGGLLFVGFVLLVVLGATIAVATEYLIVRAQNSDKLRVREALSRGFKRSGTAFLAMILVGIIVIAGLILLIIPGIYLALRLSYVLSIVANENLGAIDSIKRSFALTKGRVGDVIGAVMISAVVAMLASILIEVVGAVAGALPTVVYIAIMLALSAGYFLINMLANVTLSFRYHQSDLASRGVIYGQGTDPLNYLMVLVFIGVIVLSGYITYSLSPGIVDYRSPSAPGGSDLWLNET